MQVWCVRTIPVFIVLYLVGFVGLSGFVPPLSPTLTGAELAQLFEHHRNAIRGGQLLCLVAASLYLPWCAVMSVQMARVEGEFPVLAWLNFGGALLLVAFFFLCSMLWEVAAYRPDVDPQMLRMLNDFSWLTFVMVYPEYVVQLVAIAVVGFMDKRPRPLLPRWACFVTLWVALAGVGGGFATFFTTGAFAWNGLIGFWVPVAFFLLWLVFVIFPCLLRAARNDDASASHWPLAG